MNKINWLCFFAFAIVLDSNAGTLSDKNPGSKPNIIFILVDDLGIGDIEPYGQKLIETPYLNQMVKEGMKFTNFYSSAPVCAPARASLITGLHTGHSPIRSNKEVKPEGQWPLPDSVITIAETLKRAGYITGAYGKWGMGFVGTEGDPNNQGFDEFFGYNCQREAHNYYPDHLWHNSKKINYPGNPDKKNMYAGDEIHKNALNFISANHEKQFFLYLAYTVPHAALQVPEDAVFKKYVDKFKEKPLAVKADWKWTGRGYEPQAYPKAAYASMVSRMDSYVGDIMKTLKTMNLDENTLVIFTSDNGPHDAGGHDPVFFNGSANLRGMKRDLYEGGIRTPFIAWWPGKVKQGSVNNYIGAFYDVLPTLAELAQTSAPANDGLSFVNAIKSEPQKAHDYLYWEFQGEDAKQAVRMGKWKGVIYNAHKRPKGELELYNLDADPYEKNDIAKDNPKIVKQLLGFINNSHTPNSVFSQLDN